MFPIRDNISSRSTPWVNDLIVVACCLVFVLQLAGTHDRGDGDRLTEQYGMIPKRVLHPHTAIRVPETRRELTPFGFLVERKVYRRLAPSPINPWWTLLTCIFLHGGWLHIIGNMWFLFIFGDNVEDCFGHLKYLLFYLFCGLSASLTHLVFNPASPLPTIGASGAIAGVMGAYFVLYPRAKILTLVPIFFFIEVFVVPAPIFLAIWFLFQLVEGTSIAPAQTGVAVWAHIGGFAVGFVLVLFLRLAGVLRPRSSYYTFNRRR